jgi:hypothetical protein
MRPDPRADGAPPSTADPSRMARVAGLCPDVAMLERGIGSLRLPEISSEESTAVNASAGSHKRLRDVGAGFPGSRRVHTLWRKVS